MVVGLASRPAIKEPELQESFDLLKGAYLRRLQAWTRMDLGCNEKITG